MLPLLLLSISPMAMAYPDCDCYLTSGPEPGLFQQHRFFDFRSISTALLPNSIPNLITVPNVDSDPSNADDLTSSYFNDPSWTDNWQLQNFSSVDASTGGMYEQVASPRNIWAAENCGSDSTNANTCLGLRTSREKESFQSVLEADSVATNLLHASIRARLRVLPSDEFSSDGDNENTTNASPREVDVAPGAVLGFFIFGSDTDESDIEILTRDPPNRIRYSNQPDYDPKTGDDVPGASTDATLPDGKRWTEWLTHRLDWFDGLSQFWVDDVLVLNKSLNVPRYPAGVDLNLWGDGGEWSGEMRVGAEVRVLVEWVQLVFNVSRDGEGKNVRKRSEEMCQVACWVDGAEPGGVMVAWNDSASNDAGSVGRGDGLGFQWSMLFIQLVLMVVFLLEVI